MRRKFGVITACAGAVMTLLLTCSPEVSENKDALAYIGQVPVTQKDMDAFEFVCRNMPGEQDTLWLGRNGTIWDLIATEAIYQQVRRAPGYAKALSGSGWEWKKRYFLSKAYEIQMLQGNLGYSDTEVRNYYDTHKRDFRPVTYSKDMKPCTTEVIPPFDSIRGNVAKELFLSRYARDSATQDLRDPRMFRMFRERMYRGYFMKKYYLEKYGKPLPDSIKVLCGSNAVLDTGDLSAVLSWMAPADREEHKKDLGILTRWLLEWKLFADKAASSGYASRPEVKAVLGWAGKSEVVRKYVTRVLVPKAEKASAVDPAMALFSCWDETGAASPVIDSAKLKIHTERLSSQKKARALDSMIFRFRSRAGVRFISPDTWSDGRVKEPAALQKEADSLRDCGNLPQAQTLYSVLADYYLFTAQGKSALFELAKMQAEQQEQGRLDAIKNFRRFLVLGGNKAGERCEGMFRIAFIYDQYLHKKELAEANYRWVVENAPDCGFAGDAEVMLRHLGESLPDAETLREESKRR